jgi:RHS repeat-associated protein
MIRRSVLLLCLLLCVSAGAGELPAPASHSPALVTSNTEGAWDSETFVFDGVGNIIGIGDDVYTYDPLSRIERARVNSADVTTTDSYKYDAFGNLYERKVDGPAGLSTLPMPVQWGTNRLTGASYDDAGNMKQHGAAHRYVWDSVRMLSSRNDGQDVYIYTAGDERVAVKSGETWKWSLRDPSGRVLREMESTGPTGTWRWIEDFVHRGRQVVAAERPAAEGGRRHMHLDHIGTPRLLTDATGQAISRHDFLPLGIELTSNHQERDRGDARENKLRFTGHERDFVGGTASDNVDTLDYMHARYYRSEVGRFLSVDPSPKLRLQQPQSWNRYAYSLNNPLKYVDPDGRDAVVFIVSSGSRWDEKGGHAAVWVESGNRQGGVSRGGYDIGKNGWKDFLAHYTGQGREIHAYILKTTDAQDQAMLDFIDDKGDAAGTDVDRSIQTCGLTQNCASAVVNVLEAGGVVSADSDPSAARGANSPFVLKDALDHGQLKPQVQRHLDFVPPAPEKKESWWSRMWDRIF